MGGWGWLTGGMEGHAGGTGHSRGARAAQVEDPKAGTVQTAKMTSLW